MFNEIYSKIESGNVKVLNASKHWEYLHKALNEAENQVMLASPFIGSNVIDREFLSNLECSLKRDVTVYILHGALQTSKGTQQNYFSIVGELEKLAISYKNFILREIPGFHSKLIVCDDKFAVMTSLNLLSFRAYNNRQESSEIGLVVSDKETVATLFHSILSKAPGVIEALFNAALEAIEDKGLHLAMLEAKNETPMNLDAALAELEKE